MEGESQGINEVKLDGMDKSGNYSMFAKCHNSDDSKNNVAIASYASVVFLNNSSLVY